MTKLRRRILYLLLDREAKILLRESLRAVIPLQSFTVAWRAKVWRLADNFEGK